MQICTGKNVEGKDNTAVSSCARFVRGIRRQELSTCTWIILSSPNSFLTLSGKGIPACGTVRFTRENFPQELVTKATVGNSVSITVGPMVHSC